MSATQINNIVGPVLRAGDLADAIVAAIHDDNPDRAVTVIDKRAYLRVQVDGECMIRRETVEKHLHQPFAMQDIETVLASFAGQVDSTENHIRFYLNLKM